jgi:hypothetical protein
MQGPQDSGTKALAELVHRNFPAIDYGFAYGSGVFVQPDLYQAHHRPGAASGPMLDFIFVVADPQAWHRQASCCLMPCAALKVRHTSNRSIAAAPWTSSSKQPSTRLGWHKRSLSKYALAPAIAPAACRTCRETLHTTRSSSTLDQAW